MKTLNINIPEGYKAVKNTQEDGSIKIIFKKESGLPKTWQDAKEMCDKNNGYFITTSSSIATIDEQGGTTDLSKNVVQSEKQIKSVLAYTQLCTIVSAILGRTYIGKKSGELQYVPLFEINNKISCVCTTQYTFLVPFYLDTSKQCKHLIKHFTPLLKEFYMID
jgi:hypothetical protein